MPNRAVDPAEIVQLIAWTDSHRVAFLRAQLNIIQSLAEMVDVQYTIGHREAAQRVSADALSGCETLDRFLSDPKHVSRLDPSFHHSLQEATAAVRVRLDEIRTEHERG